jgi:hypothetical protein
MGLNPMHVAAATGHHTTLLKLHEAGGEVVSTDMNG